jgi:hypothetical protein
MPFLLDGNPTSSEVSEAVNYLLSNFNTTYSADSVSGQISGPTGQTVGFLYKYIAVKYADSFDGSVNFSNTPTNRQYYGIRNSNDTVESTNPVDYIWSKVTGGFSTTKFLFYKVNGGRQIDFAVGTVAPAYAWLQDSGAAIDLDAISVVITATPIIYQWTATSTPPTRPSTTTTYTWSTGTYTAPAGWSIEVPSNTTPGSYLWAIAITIVQTGGINTATLDWTNVAYPIRSVGYNGANGATGANGNSFLAAYRSQSQASATPTFTTPTSGPVAPTGWILTTPTVSVGEVLWYIQGEYNGSSTLTINGVGPNTTRWTGPIAASVFQDIRSDNWNGSNPPTFATPATWGTAGYYISRSTGTMILNNLGARGTLQSGSSPAISGTSMTGAGAVINNSGTFAVGDSTNNISYNGSQLTLNGNIVAVNNLQEGTSTTQSGNTFGFGNGTTLYGIATSGFFRSTNSGTAALAASGVNNIAFAAIGVNASTALFGNTIGTDSISPYYTILGTTIGGTSGGWQQAAFLQRRSGYGGSASESNPDAYTQGYARIAYLDVSTNYAAKFMSSSGTTDDRGIIVGGPTNGLYVLGAGVSTVGFTPFTGMHLCLLPNTITPVAGDIYYDTSIYIKPNVNDVLSFIALCNLPQMKGAIGVFTNMAQGSVPQYMQTTIDEPYMEHGVEQVRVVTITKPEYKTVLEENTLVLVNALGEGLINVCGENGNLVVGDLIVTSSIPGKGMKQSDDIIRSITVARSREAVTFSSPTDVQQVACVYLCG